MTRFGEFAKWAIFCKSFGQFPKAYISNRENFILSLVDFYAFGRIYIGLNCPILKHYLFFRSHCLRSVKLHSGQKQYKFEKVSFFFNGLFFVLFLFFVTVDSNQMFCIKVCQRPNSNCGPPCAIPTEPQPLPTILFLCVCLNCDLESVCYLSGTQNYKS